MYQKLLYASNTLKCGIISILFLTCRQFLEGLVTNSNSTKIKLHICQSFLFYFSLQKNNDISLRRLAKIIQIFNEYNFDSEYLHK